MFKPITSDNKIPSSLHQNIFLIWNSTSILSRVIKLAFVIIPATFAIKAGISLKKRDDAQEKKSEPGRIEKLRKKISLSFVPPFKKALQDPELHIVMALLILTIAKKVLSSGQIRPKPRPHFDENVFYFNNSKKNFHSQKEYSFINPNFTHRTQNHEILNVSPTATAEQIKKNYNKFAKQFHPDKNPNPLSSGAFQIIQEAYQQLLESR